MSEVKEESGVKVILKENNDNPSKCHTFYNPKMAIAREMVLSCLRTYTGVQNTRCETRTKCLDAFGATGITGLQWAKNCENVDVTINELSGQAVESIQQNCEENSVAVLPSTEKVDSIQTMDISGTVEDIDEKTNPMCVKLVQGDANVIMHLRQFHFIYIDPFGTTVQYLDAAFRNVYNEGIVILTSTDVGALYGKCPDPLMRNYGASNARCDYTKELAARIVLSAAVRAAGRCNKAIEVLYSVAVEHFVQVAVKIRRGVQHANKSCAEIHIIIYCQICGEWAIHPEDKYLIDNLYSYLSCECHQENTGRTALLLGPVWCGNLFQPGFLKQMQAAAKDMKLSTKCQDLLTVMQEEAVCQYTSKRSDLVLSIHDSVCETDVSASDTQAESNSAKRQIENIMERNPKKSRNCRSYEADKMPLFYYNLHKRKLSKINLPKYSQLMDTLSEAGFRVSRTHFEPAAIRTNATLSELKDIVYQNFSK